MALGRIGSSVGTPLASAMGSARVVDPSVRIEDALVKVVAGAPEPLRRVVADALAPPAKRLRPRVALLAYEAAGGRVVEDGLRAAIATELFHAASLLIDDIVDGASARRGRPAGHVAHGLRPTLLAAGFLVNRAQRLAAGDAELPTLEPDHVRVFRDAIDQVLEAEASALAHGADISVDEWLDIARGKTGALFMAAAEGGARRAGAREEHVRALRRYGTSLGIAFQAADDVLDVEGDPARTGKPAGTDGGRAPNLARIAGVAEAHACARRFADDAVDALDALPRSQARDSLASLAREAARRDH